MATCGGAPRLTQFQAWPPPKSFSTSTRLGRWSIAALLDAAAVQRWMVPAGMTSQVHVFEPREGGSFRISLTYDEPTGTGKTTAHTDTHHGRFLKLVPDQQVAE